MKRVGRRRVDGGSLDDQGRLARTAGMLRGGFAPSGVYRFTSFDEADAWMTAMMLRWPATLIRTKDTARPQDAIDRAFLEALLRDRARSE